MRPPLPRAAGVELAAEEMADLAGLGVELLRQNLGGIALAGQPRFQVVKVGRQRGADTPRESHAASRDTGPNRTGLGLNWHATCNPASREVRQ